MLLKATMHKKRLMLFEDHYTRALYNRHNEQMKYLAQFFKEIVTVNKANMLRIENVERQIRRIFRLENPQEDTESEESGEEVEEGQGEEENVDKRKRKKILLGSEFLVNIDNK